MQIATTNNLFLTDCSSFKVLTGLQTASGQDGFYQQFAYGLIRGIYSKEALNRLGDRLVALAHNAYTLRQMDIVEQASQMLMNLPLLSGYRNIGLYYHSYYLRRNNQVDEARTLLNRLTDEVPHHYRGEVIMSLAGLTLANGDYKSALPLYIEAGRAAYQNNRGDWFTALTTQRMLAVLKSMGGDNRRALADLENQFPFVRAVSSVHPSLYYGYLNSYAVELGEARRIEEAKNVCKIILASPFANAYPECRETWSEIERKGYRIPRHFVSLSRRVLEKKRAIKPDNLLRLPLPESERDTGSEKYHRNPFQQQARVTKIQEWKSKMVKEPNGNHKDENTPQEMSDRQMVMKIMEYATEDDLPDDALREMLEAVKKIAHLYKAKKGGDKDD